jgi:hypothetical protein
MANKRIKDLPLVTSTDPSDVLAIDGATTRSILVTDFVDSVAATLGTMAVQDASAVAITGGTISGVTFSTPSGLVKADVGLGSVDNTSDATKNAAVATLTNKTLTAPVINSPTGIVKADVGLGNVDNTSDSTKNSASVTLTNKTINGANNTITGITNAMRSQMAAYTLKGNATGSTANEADIDVTALTSKASPVSGDIVLIQDSAASNSFKKTTVGALASAGAVASVNGQTGALTLQTPAAGRLTLTSLTAVTTSDVAGATSIYYTPAVGNQILISDGTNFVPTIFSELTLALDSNAAHTGYQQSGKAFDLFVYSDAGTIRLVSGPAWSSDTARGTGAGTTEFQFTSGIWTNKNSMTGRFGVNSGDTVTAAVGRATYVGSFYATANGQASDTVLKRLLWNVYNQSFRTMFVSDPVSTFNYSTAAWQQYNVNTANQIEFITGLSGVEVNAMSMGVVSSSTSSYRQVFGGIGLDSSTVNSAQVVSYQSVANIDPRSAFAYYEGFPGIGRHQLRWLQYGNGTDTQVWFGTTTGTQVFTPSLSGKVLG